MKPEPVTKTVKKKTAALKKIVEKKFSRAALEKLDIDNRIASLEVTREVLIPQLRDAQMELDNVIVDCRTLGAKVYELRTDTIPKMLESFMLQEDRNKAQEKRMKLIEHTLIGVGVINCLVALYFAARYFYG